MYAQSSPEAVKLHGALTVEHAARLKSEIAEALAGRENVLLNFSQVEDLDLACLQVLYSAKASAAAAGKELHFLGSIPPRVSERLVSCGILRSASEHAEDFELALATF
jgi:anti-anti-sigma regulatory factor